MRWTAFALAAVLLASSSGDGMRAMPAGGTSTPRHRATPAPAQRWGSAAGQGHLTGSPGNRTVPVSLRGQYPPHKLNDTPAAAHNTATVAKTTGNQPHGFDQAASREDVAARGVYERTYDNPDGTRTTQFSATPLNVRQPDGSWKPVDSALSPLPGGGWHSGDGGSEVRLAASADATELARVGVGSGQAVGFGLDGAASAGGRADGDTVTYPNVLDQVDLRLQAGPGQVKETLVLRSPQAPHSYRFPLHLSGLSAKVAGGQVVLTDASGRQRAAIPAGYLMDSGTAEAGPATSTGVTYQLVTEGGRPALQVTLDSAWLRDPARVYPVMLDPTVGPPVDSSTPDGSMLVHGSSSIANPSDLMVGNVGGVPAASYLKFDGLVNRLRNHTIFGAQLQVVNYDGPSCRARPVSVHPVTAAWTPGTGYSYPGPGVGGALAERSFAHGYIAQGQSRSSCPAAGELFDLGGAGASLVQRWVDGTQANYGLSLRASTTDALAWKTFAGSRTANAPSLFVTHSPYNASYEIPNPVPDPPVLQNQAGKVKVTVTNLSADAWAPSDYYLAYRAYNVDKGEPAGQQRAANLTASVPRGGKVTFDATISAMPPGRYFIDFTMVRTGGAVFTDHQVPPGRIVLQVFDIPPVVQELYPPNGYQTPTLTPQLWARALDIDAPPGSSLQFKYEVCDRDAGGNPVGCTNSGYLASQAWTVPAGRLAWSKTYLWRVFAKDTGNEVPSPYSALIAAVPQPEITSRIAAAPYGTKDKEFDPQVGNFSTAAVDAAPTTAGPDLSLVRTYNSLDPRRDAAFGAGWTSRYDMRLLADDDGSGNVVITYQDGQQVRFGRNPDGSYAAPPGRVASLTFDGSYWKLLDKSATTYQFSASGRLMKVTDADGRSVVYSYDSATGKLAKAQVSNSQTNTAGRSLTFNWSGGHIGSITTDPVGGAPLAWTYMYTGDLLTKVCAPDSACTKYDYTAGSHYRSAVTDSKPESYWRLGESQGTGAGSDVAVNLGKDAGTYKNVTLGAAGALAGAGNTAATFNGSSSYLELPKGLLKKSRDAAVELWFKTPLTSTGGPLLGYQDAALGKASTTGVPILYVGTDGKVRGQFATGAIAPVVSSGPVNDGKWHHVVLSVTGSTQTLYVDGARSGEVTGGTVDSSLLTFNQIGAAYASTPASWPNWGSTAQRYFNGVIDEVAVYSHPLGPVAASAHYRLGTAAADEMTKVTLPSGRVAAEVSYDGNLDRVQRYTDRNGGTWKIGAPAVYGGDSDLRRSVQVLDPANRPNLYEYDAIAGRMLRSGTPLGLEIRDEDRPGSTPSPTPSPSPTPTCSKPDPNDPSFCTVIPGDSGGPVFVNHPLNGMAIRSFSYNEQGFQDVVTNENGDQVTQTFDDRGNVTSRKTCRDASSNECYTTYWTYPAASANPFDPRNQLPTEQRDGRSASATDNTYRTRYTYTPTGKLDTQTNPDGSFIRHTYTNGANASGINGGLTPAGLPLTTTDARNRVTSYAYYSNGDLGRVTKPTGLVVESTYDELGRSISKKESSDSFPAGVVTTFTYDYASRLKTVTEPATTDAVTGVRHQRRVTNTYDEDGNLVQVDVSDLLGGDPTRTTTMEYDSHGHQRRVVDAEGQETTYEYDLFGNKTSIVDANENRYDYAYTARNSVAEIRLRSWNGDPKGSGDPTPGADYLVLHSYSYDYAGRLASDTDAMGRRIEYQYYDDDLLKSSVLKKLHNPDGTTRDYVIETDTYDGAGNRIKQVAGNGKLTTSQAVGRNGEVVSTVTDPGGLARTTSFEYDLNGNVTKSTTTGKSSNVPGFDAGGSEVVSYAYGDDGLVRTRTVLGDGTSQVTSYAYDQRGLLTSTTDARGTATGADPAAYTSTFSYDEAGRLVTAIGPPVAAESGGGAPQTVRPTQVTGYNAFDEAVASKDELGNVTRTGYDKLGRPVTVTEPTYTPPGGSPVIPVTRSSYDGLGNLVETVDPLGNSTRYGYDRLNRMVSRDEPGTTNDERAVWRYTYTRTGELLSVTDPTGARVETTYDDLDRKVTLTQVERKPVADTFTTKFGYDDANNLTSMVTPGGETTVNVYDAVGELIKATDPAGVSTEMGYDFAGRNVRTVDALGRASVTSHDGFGRVSSESDLAPDGTVLRSQRYGYDPVGNLASSTDPLNHTTSYTYDAANQLVKQVEPVSDGRSITTTFGYDAAGNRTRYSDGRGNSTIFGVNSLGLPESVIEPSTAPQPNAADRTWTVGYDAAGQAVTLAAPGGVTRQRAYDAAGRLTGETGSGAESATAARSLGYDLAGRLTKVSTPSGTNTYAYNDRGALLTAAGPAGSGTFSYDQDGRLTSRADAAGTTSYTYSRGRLATLTDALTSTKQTVGYDAAGQFKTVDYGAGRVRTYEYDNLGRVASDTLRNAAGQTVASVGYGYDLGNHLTRKTTAGVAGAGDNTYGYDFAGRLTSWTGPGGSTAYGWDDSGNRVQAGPKTARYDERNRLLSDGDYTYAYTARGTLASRTSSGLTERYSFDAFDRLVSGAGQNYTYDGLDRVASRNGTPFSYADATDNPVSDGTETYARGPADDLLAVSTGKTKRLTLADQHGDVVAALDPADASPTTPAESTTYDPFGQVTARSGDTGRIGFQGDWTDPGTGQVDMGARWYDPGSATFVSRDSVDYTGGESILANRYTYAGGDPLDASDPDGHWPKWLKKVGNAIVSGAKAVGNAIVAGASAVWSGLKAAGNALLDGARWLIDKAASAISTAVHWVSNQVQQIRDKGFTNWAKDKAEQVRAAAVAKAKQITAQAKQAVSYAIKHSPLPALAAAVKPLYTGLKTVVSAAAHLPAAVVSTVRDVVNDGYKSVQNLYNKAVEAAGPLLDTLSKAASAVGDFVETHAATIAGFAAGAIVGLGCGALIGWTGVGAVACGALAGAVGSIVHDMVEGGHGWKEMLGNAVTQGAIGGLTGGLGSIGGQALGAGVRALSGGARAAISEGVSAARAELGSMVSGKLSGGLLSGAGRSGGASAARAGEGCLESNSFAPGTAVLMADGSQKPIDQVEIGDQVLATDPSTGESEARPVVDTIVGQGDKNLVEVTVDTDGTGGDGTGVIVATDHHPFWVEDLDRWVDATELRVGSLLRTSAGTYVQVTAVNRWTAHDQRVYNLTVDGDHTYYVVAANTSVLVHNCGKSYTGAHRTDDPGYEGTHRADEGDYSPRHAAPERGRHGRLNAIDKIRPDLVSAQGGVEPGGKLGETLDNLATGLGSDKPSWAAPVLKVAGYVLEMGQRVIVGRRGKR
ncbi:polymorphic toxin-type HINT domain-containing protein [Planosporangium mesophilum]|uniref:polymorphic toxin-type HINT domain-containing protein n=1 Tax=Planosporangium mesophilum TaxID=689768 RepID=UPI0019501746|nr:polymorphic toxin-type HINT domain-containing protein [Planosporangium mesophilum]